MNRYKDMLHLPHHVSSKRPGMSNHDRAAQFAPYAALTGYDAVIAETGRLTQAPVYLCDTALEELDACLAQLQRRLPEGPAVMLTCFCPDERKEGGVRTILSGVVRRVDLHHRVLLMADGREVPLAWILDIRFAEEEKKEKNS